MAKPLDHIQDHTPFNGGGDSLRVVSFGKLPSISEEQIDRLFDSGSKRLRPTASKAKSSTPMSDHDLWSDNFAKAV